MLVQDFISALQKHKGKIVAAVAANGALFGLDLGESVGGVVDQVLSAVTVAVDAYVALAVSVSAFVEALKSDPDVDTGPTTPGPVSDAPAAE